MRRILILIAMIAMFVAPALAADAPKKLNVVLILADDLGYKDLSCYGSSFYETPNLDRLATEGLRFTDSYSACPVCSPTRVSIMTGQYPARVGLTNYIPGSTKGILIPADFLNHMPLETPNIARALHDAGYATWHIGKWHLGTNEFAPEKQGFDVGIGYKTKGPGGRKNFSPWNLYGLEDGPDGKFQTDALADEAIKLITANKDKPFFLNLWTWAPHVPIDSPPDLITKYEAKAKELGLDDSKALRQDEPFPITNNRNQRVTRRQFQSNPVYAGMIENLDMNIGRVLKTIDDLGLRDNTLVIFASDNGGLATAEGSPTCNLPFSQGKGWAYEGGIRVPIIVRWPGVTKAGTESHTPVVSADLAPTILDAAGVDASKFTKLDGIDLHPLLDESADLKRDALYWHYPHYGNQGGWPVAAMRSGDWKLIERFEADSFELYNLKDDISEKHDLAKEKPDIVEKLKGMLLAWQTDVGAKMPTPNPNWKP